MIKLGKLTDYAVVVLGQLAQEGPEASRSAHALAEKSGVAEPTVAKVLKALTAAGLVISTRGAAGGYRLAKAAGHISLAEIITALEGPIAIADCVEGSDEECRVQSRCPVKGNWDRVNDAIRATLEGIKLSEMIAPACGSGRVKVFMKDMHVDCA